MQNRSLTVLCITILSLFGSHIQTSSTNVPASSIQSFADLTNAFGSFSPSATYTYNSTINGFNINIYGQYGYSFLENPWNQSTTVGPNGVSVDIANIVNTYLPYGMQFVFVAVDSSGNLIQADLSAAGAGSFQNIDHFKLYVFDNNQALLKIARIEKDNYTSQGSIAITQIGADIDAPNTPAVSVVSYPIYITFKKSNPLPTPPSFNKASSIQSFDQLSKAFDNPMDPVVYTYSGQNKLSFFNINFNGQNQAYGYSFIKNPWMKNSQGKNSTTLGKNGIAAYISALINLYNELSIVFVPVNTLGYFVSEADLSVAGAFENTINHFRLYIFDSNQKLLLNLKINKDDCTVLKKSSFAAGQFQIGFNVGGKETVSDALSSPVYIQLKNTSSSTQVLPVQLSALTYSNYLPIQFGLCTINAGQAPTPISLTTSFSAPYAMNYTLGANIKSWVKIFSNNFITFTLNPSALPEALSSNVVTLTAAQLNKGGNINQFPLSNFTFQGTGSTTSYAWFGLKDLNNLLQNLTGNEFVTLLYDGAGNLNIYKSPGFVTPSNPVYNAAANAPQYTMANEPLLKSGTSTPVTNPLKTSLQLGYTMAPYNQNWLYSTVNTLTTTPTNTSPDLFPPIIFALNGSSFADQAYPNVILLDPSQLNQSNSALSPLSNFIINDANPKDYDWDGMYKGLNQALNSLTGDDYVVLSYAYTNGVANMTATLVSSTYGNKAANVLDLIYAVKVKNN